MYHPALKALIISNEPDLKEPACSTDGRTVGRSDGRTSGSCFLLRDFSTCRGTSGNQKVVICGISGFLSGTCACELESGKPLWVGSPYPGDISGTCSTYQWGWQEAASPRCNSASTHLPILSKGASFATERGIPTPGFGTNAHRKSWSASTLGSLK